MSLLSEQNLTGCSSFPGWGHLPRSSSYWLRREHCVEDWWQYVTRPASPAKRAVRMLAQIGRTPYNFQGEAVEQAISATANQDRLLLQAPTGTGKTLIAYPSRPLLRQHIEDAGWLRERAGLPIHTLTPDDPLRIWEAVLKGPGLVCTTPHSLRNRLDRLGGLASFPPFDIAQFDEIDLFLTVDLEERRDIWPLLDEALEARTPVVGYTGTSLSDAQSREWTKRGFVPWQPRIPDDWLPFTAVKFEAVHNAAVVSADAEISEKLTLAYRAYEEGGGDPRSWRQIKLDVIGSGRLADAARAILTLHADRLKLFEGENDESGKIKSLLHALGTRRGLVLTRYVFSATAVAGAINQHGIMALQADGRMRASEAVRCARAFRSGQTPVLVITRDLGGRGLDFPTAETAVVMSPRSNYQTVAQELARIRSRRGTPKSVTVLYYADTTEALKGFRLATHLVRDNRYGTEPIFEVSGTPTEVLPEDPFERAHVSVEESVPVNSG
jgi:Helicase conserved C-terminal domain